MLIEFFEWKIEMGREEEERENIPWKNAKNLQKMSMKYYVSNNSKMNYV